MWCLHLCVSTVFLTLYQHIKLLSLVGSFMLKFIKMSLSDYILHNKM